MKTPASYRKHIPRKHHRERAQLSGRQKFGFLEKHQDYVKRARDFHKKRDAIRKLKEKAAFRNPDEFYFAMEKTQRKVRLELRSFNYFRDHLVAENLPLKGYRQPRGTSFFFHVLWFRLKLFSVLGRNSSVDPERKRENTRRSDENAKRRYQLFEFETHTRIEGTVSRFHRVFEYHIINTIFFLPY
jgi:hypothetical protein